MKMNVDQTKFCIYGSRKIVNSFRHYTVGPLDCQINKCHQYNYLGVILD